MTSALGPPIGIIAIDDNKLLGDSLERWLEGRDGFRWLGWAGDSATALKLLQSSAPDVVLLDLEVPGVDTLDLLQRIREQRPSARILILTGHCQRDAIQETLRLGASGYIVKDERPAVILDMVQRAARGEMVISSTAGALRCTIPSPAPAALRA